jgi:hypothetical protein
LIGRWRRLPSALRDGIFAALLGAVAFAPGIARDGALLGELPVRQLDVLGLVTGLGQCLPLAVRRRCPAVCLAVIAGFFCLGQLRGYPSNFGCVGILAALYSAGAYVDRRREVLAGAASGLYLALSLALFALHSPERPVDYVTCCLAAAFKRTGEDGDGRGALRTWARPARRASIAMIVLFVADGLTQSAGLSGLFERFIALLGAAGIIALAVGVLRVQRQRTTVPQPDAVTG